MINCTPKPTTRASLLLTSRRSALNCTVAERPKTKTNSRTLEMMAPHIDADEPESSSVVSLVLVVALLVILVVVLSSFVGAPSRQTSQVYGVLCCCGWINDQSLVDKLVVFLTLQIANRNRSRPVFAHQGKRTACPMRCERTFFLDGFAPPFSRDKASVSFDYMELSSRAGVDKRLFVLRTTHSTSDSRIESDRNESV